MNGNDKFDVDEVVSGFFFVEMEDTKQDDLLHAMWFKIKKIFSNDP